MGRKAPPKRPGLQPKQAHGCLATPVRLSALRHPFVGVREAKVSNPGRRKRAGGNELGCFDIVSQQIRCPRRRLETRRRGACPRPAQRGEAQRLNPAISFG